MDQEALSYYQQFADANPNSRLGQVVKEYITLLQENQFKIDDKLENFYRSLHERLIPETENNQAGMAENQGNGTGTSGTSNNGTGANGATNDTTIGGSVANTVKDAVDNVMDGGR